MADNMDYKMTNKTSVLCVKIGKFPYKNKQFSLNYIVRRVLYRTN